MKTIEELKAMRDVWPTVVEHIPQAINRAHNQLDQILEDPELLEHLERKFRKGEAEHGGGVQRATGEGKGAGRAAGFGVGAGPGGHMVVLEGCAALHNAAGWETKAGAARAGVD